MSEQLYVYKPQPVKTMPSKLHTIEDHEYWVKRNKNCPYCQNGSVPVHRSVIVGQVDKR